MVLYLSQAQARPRNKTVKSLTWRPSLPNVTTPRKRRQPRGYFVLLSRQGSSLRVERLRRARNPPNIPSATLYSAVAGVLGVSTQSIRRPVQTAQVPRKYRRHQTESRAILWSEVRLTRLFRYGSLACLLGTPNVELSGSGTSVPILAAYAWGTVGCLLHPKLKAPCSMLHAPYPALAPFTWNSRAHPSAHLIPSSSSGM